MSNKKNSKDVLSAIFLLSGTCIGAGMLAVPQITGLSGFIPALLVTFLTWIYMWATGLLILEVTLNMGGRTHLLSIANKYLGSFGKRVTAAFFIFLYYALLVSYMDGLTTPLYDIFYVSKPLLLIFFTLILGTVVLVGRTLIHRVNYVLITGMVLTFILLTFIGSRSVKITLFERSSWQMSYLAFPILFSAFGYHNVIPSIATHLNFNRKLLRRTLFFGTLIPFLTYMIWQTVVIGNLSLNSLIEAQRSDVPITEILEQRTAHPFFGNISFAFGFFALATSFIGVALSMVDFFADGLKWDKKKRQLPLFLIVFAPPFIITLLYSKIFSTALNLAGGYGEAVLNGILPVLMVASARYITKEPRETRELFGGKFMLTLLFLGALSILLLELFYSLGLIRHNLG